MPLVHGMGMEFNPSKITESCIKEYKITLDNWKRDVPNSDRINYDLGWYNFLISNYDSAIIYWNHYIEAMDSGKISKDTNFSKGFTLSFIAKCYDLEGKRDMAKDYYNKSMIQLQANKKERFIDFVVSPYLKEPYKK